MANIQHLHNTLTSGCKNVHFQTSYYAIFGRYKPKKPYVLNFL